MRGVYFLLILLATFLTGCGPKAGAPGAGQGGDSVYAVRGVITQIADDRRHVTIAHEAIAGYMPAMTMEFPVRDTNSLNGLSPADEITFKLMISDDEDWIQDLQFIAHSTASVGGEVPESQRAELKPGDLPPDCALTAEDGRILHLSDFHGQALAFTFFFTRCPLPDFCPRMNRNFAETRKLLSALPHGPANWQLLSISFDPGFDDAGVLSGYAETYRNGDASHWLFAAAPTNSLAELAPSLNLMIMRDRGNILSHTLRTVVLDPQGRIFRQLDGNQWTPQDLADAIVAAARNPGMGR